MIQTLIPNLQAKGIKNFVDVFAGSCVVSASFKEVEKYWINDKDENLYKILIYLLSTDKNRIALEIDKIVEKYSLHEKDYKAGYLRLRDKYNDSSPKDVRELFTLVLFGFNQQIRFNSKGKFNTPSGKTLWTEYQKEKIKKFVEAFEDKETEIHNLDFEEFYNHVSPQTERKETIYYLDPPYLITNATYNNHWGDKEEIRLLNLLTKMNSPRKKKKWILSNVLESKGKVNKHLENFISKNKNLTIIEINLNYKNSNYQRKDYKTKDREVIIRNF